MRGGSLFCHGAHTGLLLLCVAAFFVDCVSAKNKESFPLVGVCLGITGVGIVIAFAITLRRPMEPVEGGVESKEESDVIPLSTREPEGETTSIEPVYQEEGESRERL